MDLIDEIREKAYFIWLYKDRNRIKSTDIDNWRQAEDEIMAIKNMSINYLKNIWGQDL